MKIGVAFGICIIFFTIGADRSVPALLKARRDARELMAQIVALRWQNARLRARAEALRSDPATIERTARELLGFARKDELVVLRDRR
jgi:cell division protein FtsB